MSNLPTVPVAPDYVNEQLILAPGLRSSVGDGIAFLLSPPAFVGAQTNTLQGVAPSTLTAIQWDTESYDNYGGHRIATSSNTYYGMIPGWYLCTCSSFINSTTNGDASSGIGGVQSGGANQQYMGQRIPMGAAPPVPGTTSAKLMLMTQTGTFGGGSNDYIQGIAWNGGGISQSLLNGSNQFPYMTATWVAAQSGTSSLPVPVNAAWPVPPSYITTSFINTNVSNAIQFLTYPPIYEAFYNTTGQRLASVTSVPSLGPTMLLNSETVDNYNAGINGSWTAPVSGLYYAYGQIAVSNHATSVSLGAGLNVNSSNYGGTPLTLWGSGQQATQITSAINCAVVSRHLRLNAGDTLSLSAWQNDSGANGVNVLGVLTNNWSSRLIIVWRSA